MVSGPRGDDLRTKICPTTPHFFKIVLEETLQQNKLLIPKKFVQKYGDTLSNMVFLKLPCGLEWELGLTSCNGKVWLDKGWPEFARYYSIQRGSMLVFRYEGNSEFHAFIFDTTTVEIAYPTNPTPFEKSKNQGQSQKLKRKEIKDDDDDDDSVEILEGFSPCQKAGEVSKIPSYHPPKRVKTRIGETRSKFSPDLGLEGTHFRANEATNSMSNGASNSSKSKMKGKLGIPAGKGGGHKCITKRWMKSEVHSQMQQLTTDVKAKVRKIANDFKSEYPKFTIAMQPSYLLSVCGLHVPTHFANTYLSNKPADAILKVLDGRTWPVELSIRKYYSELKNRFVLRKGWIDFVHDNKLEVGDVCVFALTRRTKIFFEVFIFRKNGITNSPKSTVHKAVTFQVKPKGRNNHFPINRKTGEFERSSGFQSENPFFTVALQASYTAPSSYFHVPNRFARTYIDKSEVDVVLWVADSRSWSVQCKVRNTNNQSARAEFCHGWYAFVQDNSLKAGDICTFELANNNANEISFKVSIVRASDHVKYDHLAAKPKRNASAEFESGCTSNNETEQDDIKVESPGEFRKPNNGRRIRV